MLIRNNNWVWLFLILLMSSYVTYMHVTDSRSIDMGRQMDRHERIMEGDSEFFNPWQYRIFAPMLLEAFIYASNSAYPGQYKEAPYLILHFIQLVLLFYLALYFYQTLGLKNPYLLGAGLMLVCYSMAASVFRSDLSFNTYFDVAFYLLAAILILRKAYFWVIPLAFFAALNRETSAFIPLMLLIPFTMKKSRDETQKLIAFGLSGLVFIIAFLGTRWYFGYQLAVGINGMTSPLDYLKFNLTFFTLYPLMIGTLGIVPIIVILNLGKLDHLQLKAWFWTIVPAWFLIHFLKSNAMETRLFLVPHVLIFVPAFLWMLERWALTKDVKGDMP